MMYFIEKKNYIILACINQTKKKILHYKILENFLIREKMKTHI
jgi:hypothetical protein